MPCLLPSSRTPLKSDNAGQLFLSTIGPEAVLIRHVLLHTYSFITAHASAFLHLKVISISQHLDLVDFNAGAASCSYKGGCEFQPVCRHSTVPAEY